MDNVLNISESLHESEIFKGLTSQQYADLLKRGRSITLQSKSILFHQGDPAISCVLVNRGRLKLTKLNEQGKEVILRYIGAGESTAAVAVLKNWNYPVTAESIEETDVTVWDKPTMIQVMHQYRVYFYRKEKKDSPFPGTGDVPLKPTAMLNFKKIDNSLANIAVNFWNLTWGKETPAINLKTKLLLSLANAAGAGRYRQATRELVKAYSIGVTVDELDELFSLFVWNGGIGTFASEIGTSTLFGAYQIIKTIEGKGKTRKEVMGELMEKFGEKNPEVKVMAT